MKITKINIIPLKLANRTLLVKIDTDEGIYGLAECRSGQHGQPLIGYIEDVVQPLMIGRDPLQTERNWEALMFGIDGVTTNLPPIVIGVVDTALWDIMGKATGLPVHKLMGGAARHSVKLYWSTGNGWRKSPEEMLNGVKEGWEQGFRAFKIRMDWRSYRQDADPEKDFQMFKICREFLPDNIPLGFDANNGYSVSTAIKQGKRFEELGIAHFEEPLPQYDLPGLRQVVDALDVPISVGEQESTRWRFRDLIDIANPDILQPDLLRVGGLSEMKKVFDLAITNNKPIMPHSPVAGINSIASIQAYSTVNNATRPHEYSTDFIGQIKPLVDLYGDSILPVNGSIRVPDLPGYGIGLNETALKSILDN